MPKQSPVPEAIDKGFWDACNEERLVIQHCTACDRLQQPPEETCQQCGSKDNLGWKQMSGRGIVYTYAVMHDTNVPLLFDDQPFNAAIIHLLDDAGNDTGMSLISHLPGTPVDQVPMDAPVEVVFETTQATGQKVPEFRVVGSGNIIGDRS
jgi:uncharacterized OB-fold protein